MLPAVNHFLELLVPRLCVVCGEKLLLQEQHICLRCLLYLPRTDFRLPGPNRMERLFTGRVPLEQAYAYFEFRKGGRYRKIIHQMKYRGQQQIGNYFGERFAAELLQAGHDLQADLLCPVPLHPRKKRTRGFNQSEQIAIGLSRQFKTPVLHGNLRRITDTGTQTSRSRYERWENVEKSFEVIRPELFAGKHIALVDDVVTTGATLEACASAILGCCDARISMLCLGIA